MEHTMKRTPSPASPTCNGGGWASSSTLAFLYGTLKRGFGNHWLMQELLAGSHAQFVGFACTKRRLPLVCGPFHIPFLIRLPSPSGHHVHGELYRVDALAISRLDELEGVSRGHYERRPVYVRLVSGDPDAEEHAGLRDAEMDMVSHENVTDDRRRHAEMDMVSHENVTDDRRLVSADLHAEEHAGLRDAEMDMVSYENVVDERNMTDVDGLDAPPLCTLAGPLSSCRMCMDPHERDEMDELPSLSETSRYLHAEAYFAASEFGLRIADCAPHIPCYTEKEASKYVLKKDRPNDRTFLEHVHAWIENQGLIYL